MPFQRFQDIPRKGYQIHPFRLSNHPLCFWISILQATENAKSHEFVSTSTSTLSTRRGKRRKVHGVVGDDLLDTVAPIAWARRPLCYWVPSSCRLPRMSTPRSFS